MKYIIAFIISLTAFAGTVKDNANMLGAEAPKLESAIIDLPVFIETHESLGNIKQYADEKVHSYTHSGFIIVVTTHPRAWRISMTPEHLVSSEYTRVIGDKMSQYFRDGRFHDGFLHAAQSLNTLLLTPPVEVSSVSKTGSHNDTGAFALLAIFAVSVIGCICIGAWFVFREKAYSGGLNHIRPSSSSSKIVKKDSFYDLPRTSYTTQIPHPRKDVTDSNAKAKRVFNSLSPATRRAYVETHGGNSSMLSDPMAFYLFYSAMTSHDNPSHTSSASSSSSSYSSETPKSSSSSYSSETPKSSSSTDYSSYSSDSSSSFDSSSFSDSSGSSGSW